ncbi:MAG: transglutaminase-like domain-containing protein [Myxococcaceae bacterium]
MKTFRRRNPLVPWLAALALAVACQKAPAPAQAAEPAKVASPKPRAAVSDVLSAPRPKGGEYFGLYLMNKKVGYIFASLGYAPGSTTQIQAVNEFVFKANVGTKTSERRYKETRLYEARPGGRLLSFVVDAQGDGGDQLLEATATPTGLRVIRKRPNQPNDVLNLPPSREVVEDADQARVALLRGKKLEGIITDGQDLENYKVVTTVGESTTRMVAGVSAKLKRAITLSEKEKVPVEAYVDEKGRMLEIDFGATMKAVAEPESVAKRLDQVEVFGLTRVVLPKLAPDSVREVPGSLTLVLQGLPEQFQKGSYRQSYKKLEGGKVEVTIKAALPTVKKRVRPLADPNGGANLKSSIIVESDNAQIKEKSREVLAGEKDAYAATKKIVSWVNGHMTKDYGASADRATDVLRQMRGDCTEHALLSVALLRAAGIPAKRVDGVVYMVNEDQVPALYWHEWVEAWVGEWTQLDPTFGQEVADATHFAVGEDGNAEITPLIGQLKVLDVR